MRIRKIGNKTVRIIENKPRRKRQDIYCILKRICDIDSGDRYHIYCVQRFNSKTLDYFVEKIYNESLFTAENMHKKCLNLRDCIRYIKADIKEKQNI